MPKTVPHSFWDHLDELRSRLFKGVVALAFTTVLSFFLADQLLQWLLKPSPLALHSLTSLQPAGLLMQTLWLSLLCGFILSLPLLLYQIWAFVAPALSAGEGKAFVVSLYVGTFLFAVGALFAYYYVVPSTLGFFLEYSQQMGVQAAWTIDAYLSYVLMMLFSFGLAFELPLVLILLVRLQILNQASLVAKRPYIIVGISVLAALLTPPDVMSQLLLGVPLWILFEATVFVLRYKLVAGKN